MRKSKAIVFLLILTFIVTGAVSADIYKYGSKGQQVKNIQTKLKALGFYNGSATGYFGSQTKNAVIKFQKKKGITPDGVAGVNTQKLLFSNTTSRGTGYNIREIQTVLKKLGLYTKKIDGVYGIATKTAVQKFQKSKGLKVTGKLDDITVKKISDINNTKATTNRGTTSLTKKDDVELLDWWSAASSVLYRGATAKVIDLATGKSFNIMRTYGTNHADCETLTIKDTKTMKDIWGGFSWDRRSVIVEIDGRRLAASAAAMPHAGLDSKDANIYVSGRSGGYGYGVNLDTIKNNGMDGHFDIHFLNSKTHGTNKVDAKHQKAILKAANK